VARIAGSVTDERGVPYKECRLELLNADKRLVFDHRPISSEFKVSFVIAPGPAWYPLRIACKESDETFTTEPKELAGTSETPLNLGNVRLKRRAR
jgi:hypothetical protein